MNYFPGYTFNIVNNYKILNEMHTLKMGTSPEESSFLFRNPDHSKGTIPFLESTLFLSCCHGY